MGDEEDWAAVASAQEQKLLNKQLEDMKLKGVHGGGDSVLGTVTITTGSGRGRGRGLYGSAAAPPPSVGANAAAPSRAPGDPVKEGGDAWNDTTETESDANVPKADVSLMNKLLRSQLVNTTSDIEILRKDPNSPLYHIKNFNELRLKPELLRGVYDMGFNAPSKIQETALPALLADPPMNMIAQSQSGTGKTAAFVLTMLSRCDPTKNYPQCLCLAPTYELALQIGDVTKKMAKFMQNVGICYAIRGESASRNVAIQDHIVIGTPGTVFDWCTRFKCIDLKKIDVFVLDEADVMIDKQGHADQSVRIQRGLRKDCQLLFFSATYDDQIMKFAETIVSDPMIIRLKREEESLDTIRQYYIECQDLNDKFEALSNIYGSITIGQSMIFCHTRKTASWLAQKMTEQGNAVALLTGELDVQQRAAIINRFRAGKEKVLITTNVSARGIDVEQVTVVVNFDLPVDSRNQVDCETYLHRIGRTGRFGKRGIAINMIDGTRSHNMMLAIEKHFGRAIKRLDALNPDEIEKITQP